MLLPLETEILATALEVRRGGQPRFHGFSLARAMAEESGDARGLVAHGTLYKALGRLEDAGLLTSAWEDAEAAAAQRRPRRRLYEVTGEGERALAATRQALPAPQTRPRPRVQPA
jgi:DNA-binding PadR family transcriptional regulator